MCSTGVAIEVHCQAVVLSCKTLTVETTGGVKLLQEVSASFLPHALNAIVGPSGCGKSTLVRALMGVAHGVRGDVYIGNEPVSAKASLVGQVGFAPQFSIALPQLTVEENLRFALELFVRSLPERASRLELLLDITGLAPHRHKKTGSLSGGQLRRMGLALELTLDPECLICDEVTSGLDPTSEQQILDMMRRLVEQRDKTFICIIHNLSRLDVFDTVTVLYQGHLVFQGSPVTLREVFDLKDMVNLYEVLGQKPAEVWASLWQGGASEKKAPEYHLLNRQPESRPGWLSQLGTLLRRRCLLWTRDRGYLALTLAITLGFPVVVVIFSLGGLPQIETLALEAPAAGLIEGFQEQMRVQVLNMNTAQLVTGLIMFQVILLTLMGSNNGAREIAGERPLLEKEALNGLSPLAYVASKAFFCGGVAAVQGVYMTAFVKAVCGFPGSWLEQSAVLALACVSMTWVCLGVSALFRSAEKASLLSIYLVGFQLPLSGVVLALPESLVWVCRPVIAAWWGWSGYVASLKESRIYDAWQNSQPEWTGLPPVGLSLAVLAVQGLFGLGMALWGCRRKAQCL